MKTLLLMRHATAADKKTLQADVDKELTQLGERQAGQAGLWLKEQDLVPEHILVSPAERTMSTCLLLLEAIGRKIPVQQERIIYAGTEKDLYYLLQDLPEEADIVLLLGHNPTISYLASQICQEELHFEPANIAVIRLSGPSWSDARAGGGKLSGFYKS